MSPVPYWKEADQREPNHHRKMSQKKKLLVLLGAGSSLSQGMPSVGELDQKMQAWAAELVTGNIDTYFTDRIVHKVTAGKPNYYEIALKNREAYYHGTPSYIQEFARNDYERVLGDLHGFMNGLIKKPSGDPLLQWLQKADVLEGLNLDFTDDSLFYAVSDQIKGLCIALAGHMRQLSRDFENKAASLASFALYSTFLRGLKDHFDLGVYTLNYDTVALAALPDFFTGFDTSTDQGRFAPAEVHRRDRGFIYHLHGSVHHSAEPMAQRPQNDRTLGTIVWQKDLSKCCDDRGDLRTATDQRRMVPTTLIAGGWKLDQIQEDPFQTFYSALPRHAHDADAILIGGYGFGDVHINSILQAMLRARTARGQRPPVLVLGNTTTPNNLAHTLISPNTSSGWISAGLSDSQFEVPNPTTPSTPVVLWRGGFEKASARVVDIIELLDRN
jgi:hypothetical protein